MDRERAGSRTREQHRARRLAITRAIFRRELCAWPHSTLSSLDNARGKARSISRPSAASKWRDYASHKLPSFRAKASPQRSRMGRGMSWRRPGNATRCLGPCRLAFSVGMTVFKEWRLLFADSGMGSLQVALKVIGGLETAVP